MSDKNKQSNDKGAKEAVDNQDIRHIHDRAFKLSMQNKEAAKEFFQSSLSKELVAKINWDVFELKSGSHVDSRHKELIIDVLYQTEIAGEAAFLYLLTSHQSTVDKFMPFWVLRYSCNVMEKHLKDHQKIPLVIPLVLYHGKQKWEASTDLKDLVDASPELIDEYFLKPFKLIDLNKVPDEELEKHPWWGALALALKYIHVQNMMPYLQAIFDLLKSIQETQNGKILALRVFAWNA